MQKLRLTCLLLLGSLWLSSCSVRSLDEPISLRPQSQPLEKSSLGQPTFLAFEVYAPKAVRNVRVYYECQGEPETFYLKEADFNQAEDQLTLLVLNKCAPKNVERLKLVLEYGDNSTEEVTAN